MGPRHFLTYLPLLHSKVEITYKVFIIPSIILTNFVSIILYIFLATCQLMILIYSKFYLISRDTTLLLKTKHYTLHNTHNALHTTHYTLHTSLQIRLHRSILPPACSSDQRFYPPAQKSQTSSTHSRHRAPLGCATNSNP